MSTYEKYGEEWHNEVMKVKKETIIYMFAGVARERDDYEKQLSQLKAERDELKEYYETAMRTPYKDEEHCTCVPALMRVRDNLLAEREALIEENKAYRLVCGGKLPYEMAEWLSEQDAKITQIRIQMDKHLAALAEKGTQ